MSRLHLPREIDKMAQDITATLWCGDTEVGTSTYSVIDYVDHVLLGGEQYSQELVELVGAVADYGHYMQPFLSDSAGWKIGPDYEEIPLRHGIQPAQVEEAIDGVKDYATSLDQEPQNVAQLTYSLALDSKTSIYIYLRPTDGFSGTVSADTGKVTGPSGGRYRIEIANIPAHELGATKSLNITVGASSFTFNVSPLSYFRAVLNSDSGDLTTEHARYAVTSLYRYWDATMAYRASTAQGA